MVGTRTASALAVAAVVATFAVANAASANAPRLHATLDAHHVITPKNEPWKPPASVANAHGTLTGTLGGSSGRRLSWRITYSGLGSSPVKIADVHFGPAKQFGPILFRLCNPCKSGQRGTKKLTRDQIQTIKAGMAWVTVITGKYPNGVIRGTIRYSP
jgi:hypothetical protein